MDRIDSLITPNTHTEHKWLMINDTDTNEERNEKKNKSLKWTQRLNHKRILCSVCHAKVIGVGKGS